MTILIVATIIHQSPKNMKKYLNSNENDLKALTYSRKHQKLVAIASGSSTMHSLHGDESKDNNNNSGVSGYTISL